MFDLPSPASPYTMAPIGSAISREVFGFKNLILERRMAAALQHTAASDCYPIFREFSCAARINLEAAFDALALDPRWTAQRTNASAMLLDQAGALISARGQRKATYCSCTFEIWAVGVDEAEQARAAILAHFGPYLITEPMIAVDWCFVTKHDSFESVRVEEVADAPLLDEAYPYLAGGVDGFIRRYLDADDCVLVLQGPPGTGKTRLIRSILAAMTRRKGGTACAVYTTDTKALETDEIFIRFVTDGADAFVMEDADHLLGPRSSGNDNLHRFLAIADGIIRAQGRKIIFSTNLPNVGDLDDALVRPGRCFARIEARRLKVREALTLVQALARRDATITDAAEAAAIIERSAGSLSLAEVFQLLRKSDSACDPTT